MEHTGRGVRLAAGLATAAFLIAAAVAGSVRAPWLDELLTLGILDHPGQLYGDPHPPLYYAALMVAEPVSAALGWLRLVGLLVAPLVALGLGRLVLHGLDRTTWRHSLVLAGPAVFGTAVFVQWGTDLRMYGATTLVAVVAAVTLHSWEATGFDAPTSRQCWAVVYLLALLAGLHVWGGLIAATMAVTLLLLVPSTLRSGLLLRGAVVAPLVGLLYWIGPLNVPSPSAWGGFDGGQFARWLHEGLSTNPAAAIVLLAAWLLSLWFAPRHTLPWFDLPAVATVATAIVVAPWLDLARVYTLMPALALLLAGTLVRTMRLGTAPYLAAMAILVLNAGLHAPGLFTEHHAWGASTDALARNHDGDCPVEVLWPPWMAVENHARLVPDVTFVHDQDVACSCDRRWVIANHADATRQADVLEGLDDPHVVARWPHGLVGTVAC